MPKATLKAYAEENNLQIKYAYDEKLNRNRKVITGFSSIAEVLKCTNQVKGNVCLFAESENECNFIEQLNPESMNEDINIENIGVFVLSKFDLPYLREDRCSRCLYCRRYDRLTKTNHCARTKRSGSIERAHWCEEFKHRNSSGSYYKDGIPVRSKTKDDYRTESQWLTVGRYVKDGEEGVEMFSTMNTSRTYVYYLIEQTDSLS